MRKIACYQTCRCSKSRHFFLFPQNFRNGNSCPLFPIKPGCYKFFYFMNQLHCTTLPCQEYIHQCVQSALFYFSAFQPSEAFMQLAFWLNQPDFFNEAHHYIKFQQLDLTFNFLSILHFTTLFLGFLLFAELYMLSKTLPPSHNFQHELKTLWLAKEVLSLYPKHLEVSHLSLPQQFRVHAKNKLLRLKLEVMKTMSACSFVFSSCLILLYITSIENKNANIIMKCPFQKTQTNKGAAQFTCQLNPLVPRVKK